MRSPPRFADVDQVLLFTSAQTDTSDEAVKQSATSGFTTADRASRRSVSSTFLRSTSSSPGPVRTGVTFSQCFNDPGKYRVEVDNQLNVRLFRGLGLNVNGNAQVIRNQIYLDAGDVPPEEIPVSRRQLATAYSYYVAVGISYTFGSVYNNVVNPRFGG